MSWLCTSSSFFSLRKSSWIIPENFWNNKRIGKLKNGFLRRRPGFSISIKFFSFAFRDYSGVFAENLIFFFDGISGRDSSNGLSFSVLVPFFQKISEKNMKNWKTASSRDVQEEILIWIQLFIFSVLLRNGTGKLFNCFLKVSSLQFCLYYFNTVPPQKKFPKSRGQEARKTLWIPVFLCETYLSKKGGHKKQFIYMKKIWRREISLVCIMVILGI